MFKPIISVIVLIALLQFACGAVPAPTSLTAESSLDSETTLSFKWDYPTDNCTFEGSIAGDLNSITFKKTTKSISFSTLKKATYYTFAVSAVCGFEASAPVVLSTSTAIILSAPETVTFTIPEVVLTKPWPKGSYLDIITHPSYCSMNAINIVDKYAGTTTFANTISIISLTASSCRSKLPITNSIPVGTYSFKFVIDVKYNTGNETAVQAFLNLSTEEYYEYVRTIPLPPIRGSLPAAPTSVANSFVASVMILALGFILMLIH